MNAESIIHSLKAMIGKDLWCKDMGERIVTEELFIRALRKGGRGMPLSVRRMCLDLGYLRKEGERIETTYHLTPAGGEFADQQEHALNGLIHHLANH